MITEEQAQAVVDATSYRNWEIVNVKPSELTWYQMLGMIKVSMDHKVPVRVTYEAPNSDESVGGDVRNDIYVAVPRTETEAEFARALYEVVSIIEEHERREFFRVEFDAVRDRKRDVGGGNRALFHPHGINRNKMFHDLDGFARSLAMESMAGAPMTADAVS